MFLAILTLAAAASNPLEPLRLTPDQMFHLQLPYRFKVSIAEIGRDGLGRWELQVRDYYCNDIRRMEIKTEPASQGPYSPLRRNAIRGSIVLALDDVVSFPEDRYSHNDSYVMAYDGEYLLVIHDRLEKTVLWPPPSQPVP